MTGQSQLKGGRGDQAVGVRCSYRASRDLHARERCPITPLVSLSVPSSAPVQPLFAVCCAGLWSHSLGSLQPTALFLTRITPPPLFTMGSPLSLSVCE